MNTTEQATGIAQVIKTRRTIKPDKMNGKKIPDEIILELLQLADAAPTHAKTEPWRFIVFSGDNVKKFTKRHAELYKLNTPEASFTQQKYDNLEKLGDNVSHIIISWMKRVPSHKIPEIEEISATSAAIQNILLAATEKGIASFWSTGGLTHHPALHKEFNLGEEDIVLAILYLGYTNEPFTEGNRIIPLQDKIEWIK
ncbi:MAG: nitroreductase [Chitinophagaceae bacterium]|nr:nitroreductase [Chitinophagaceae bacterium]